jgi:uncharacterized protein (TIGR02300 family)
LVAKPELGVKRVCGSCGSKFYDLARSPIVCPKCGNVTRLGTRIDGAMKHRICAKCHATID